MTETITLENDGDLDVRFEGYKLGSWSSRRRAPEVQNDDTRWTEIHVYWRPAAEYLDGYTSEDLGRYIVQEIGVTLWQGEVDRHAVHIADTEGDLVKALGTGRLAKEVYRGLGIEAVREG